MQQKPQVSPRKSVKFLDTKVLIVTLSTAVTIGFWNIFSNNALEVEKVKANNNSQPYPPSNGDFLDLAPLPTLIPRLSYSIPQQIENTATVLVQPGQSTPLRSVTAPTQKVVQKNKPIIDSAVVVSGGGDGGGNQPVATTRSSR